MVVNLNCPEGSPSSYFGGIDRVYWDHLPECNSWVQRDLNSVGLCFAREGGFFWKVGQRKLSRYVGPVAFWTIPGRVYHIGVNPTESWHHYFVAIYGPRTRRWVQEGMIPDHKDQKPWSVANPEKMSALFDSIFTTISEECRQADRLTHHLEGFILDYFACLREEHKIWSVPDKIQAKCDSLSIDDLVQVSWPAIASEIGISIVHFRRVFKSLYDLTPLQWRRSRILKTIAEALPLNDQQLNLYAAKFGYEDYSSFLRDFRKEYGVPPSKYRG